MSVHRTWRIGRSNTHEKRRHGKRDWFLRVRGNREPWRPGERTIDATGRTTDHPFRARGPSMTKKKKHRQRKQIRNRIEASMRDHERAMLENRSCKCLRCRRAAVPRDQR